MQNDRDPKEAHETQRKQLWINAWTKVAGASNCVNQSSPTTWADNALKEFDKRFPAPIKTE